jgi:Kdo2-lipid IVA lauroyltransferase/acyltransferase
VKIIEQLIVFGLITFRALMRLLPSRTMLTIAAFVGRQVRFFARGSVSICRVQIEYYSKWHLIVYGSLPKQQTNKIISQVYSHLGEYIGEVLIFDRIVSPASSPQKTKFSLKHITEEGTEAVVRLSENGKSALLIGGHLGCIDLLAPYFTRHGVRLSSFARLPNYSSLETFFRRERGKYETDLIWRNDPESSRKIFRVLREGRILGAFIDQDSNLENCFTPFFGLAAAHPAVALKLAIRLNIPIMTSFIIRVERLHHHIETKPIQYEHKDPDALRQVIKVFNKRLEDLIVAYPEQWLWFHRRWRRRPGVDYNKHPAELRSTEDYLKWLSEQVPQV